MNTFLLVVQVVAALEITRQSIVRLNRMGRATRLSLFLAWALLGGSAAGFVADVLASGALPDARGVLLITAVAVALSLDRRRTR